MKIQPKDIISFLKSPSYNYTSFLIYGPDQGKISEYATFLERKLSEGSIDTYIVDGYFLKNNLESCKNFFLQKNFFSNQKILKIQNLSSDSISLIKDLHSLTTDSAKMIMVAQELAPSNPVRIWAEKEKNIAVLAAYKDDRVSLNSYIRKLLSDKGIKSNNQVLELLVKTLEGDRALVKSEIEKLNLYIGDDFISGFDHIKKVLSNSLEFSLELAYEMIANKKISDLSKWLDQAIYSGYNAVQICRFLQNMLLQLYAIKVDNNLVDLNSVRSIKPPIFFKYQDSFLNLSRKLGAQDILRNLNKAVELEITLKSNNTPNTQAIFSFLHSLFFIIDGS